MEKLIQCVICDSNLLDVVFIEGYAVEGNCAKHGLVMWDETDIEHVYKKTVSDFEYEYKEREENETEDN